MPVRATTDALTARAGRDGWTARCIPRATRFAAGSWPRRLRRLAALGLSGQLLGEDPNLGQRTVVSWADEGAGGTLVASETQIASTGTTIQLQLQGN